MMKSLPLIGILAALAAPALAQDAPRGSEATGCDVTAFEPVVSERTGETLYWTNRTCPAASSSGSSMMGDGMMGDGMMGGGMGDGMSGDGGMSDDNMMN